MATLAHMSSYVVSPAVNQASKSDVLFGRHTTTASSPPMAGYGVAQKMCAEKFGMVQKDASNEAAREELEWTLRRPIVDVSSLPTERIVEKCQAGHHVLHRALSTNVSPRLAMGAFNHFKVSSSLKLKDYLVNFPGKDLVVVQDCEKLFSDMFTKPSLIEQFLGHELKSQRAQYHDETFAYFYQLFFYELPSGPYAEDRIVLTVGSSPVVEGRYQQEPSIYLSYFPRANNLQTGVTLPPPIEDAPLLSKSVVFIYAESCPADREGHTEYEHDEIAKWLEKQCNEVFGKETLCAYTESSCTLFWCELPALSERSGQSDEQEAERLVTHINENGLERVYVWVGKLDSQLTKKFRGDTE